MNIRIIFLFGTLLFGALYIIYLPADYALTSKPHEVWGMLLTLSGGITLGWHKEVEIRDQAFGS